MVASNYGAGEQECERDFYHEAEDCSHLPSACGVSGWLLIQLGPHSRPARCTVLFQFFSRKKFGGKTFITSG
jgi:hypothetical protein